MEDDVWDKIKQGYNFLDPFSDLKKYAGMYLNPQSEAPITPQENAQYYTENLLKPDEAKALRPGYGEVPNEQAVSSVAQNRGLSPEEIAGIQEHLKSIDPIEPENMVNRIGSEGLPVAPMMGTIRRTGETGFLALVPKGKDVPSGEKAALDLIDAAEKKGISGQSLWNFVDDLTGEMGKGNKPPFKKDLKKGLTVIEGQQIDPDSFVGNFHNNVENLQDRFNNSTQKVVYEKPVKKVGDTLFIDTYGSMDIHNAPKTVGGDIPTKASRKGPMAYPGNAEKIKKALDAHDGQIVLGDKSDPFMWQDSKYNHTKKLLEEMNGRDLLVRTRSDLVGRDDYIPLLQKNNSTVQIILPDVLNEEYARATEPGAPSIQRRLEAARRLKDAGVNVDLVQYPSTKEQIANNKSKFGSPINVDDFSDSPELRMDANDILDIENIYRVK